MRYLRLLSITLFLFSFASTAVLAQFELEVDVDSRQNEDPPEQIFVYAQEGNNLKKLQALPYPRSSVFTVKNLSPPGLYWIGTSPAALYPIVLGKDKTVSGTMTFEDGMHNFQFDSKDQQAYKRYDQLREEFETGYKEFTDAYRLNIRNKKTAEEREAYQQEVIAKTDEMAHKFNDDLQQLRKDYPETYVGKYLVPIARTHVPDRDKDPGEQMQERKVLFFKGVDFSDNNIMYNPYLHLKLFQYFNEFRRPSMGGFDGAIDDLMQLPGLTPELKSFMVNYFIEVFGLRGPDQAMEYLMENYADAMQDTTLGAKLVLEREDNLQPGKPALEMELPDESGNLRKLRDNLGSKYTMLFIWSSTCGHCIETLPAITEAYMNYHEKGLNVYALAIDAAQDQWLDAMEQRQLPWVNVVDTRSWESPFVLGYGMRSTPYLAIIDQNGNLVEVDVKPEKLPSLLRDLFDGE